MPRDKDRLRWFRDAQFGLFIHWGIYSLLGRGEQVLFREHLIPSEYRKLAERFNPKRFNADEWAAMAKDAGMKYAVLTTKHHDGFCLFDTATTDYSSVKTRAGRDFVAEYVRAFRRAGLKVGLYFSLADWNYPAYFNGPRKDAGGFKAFIEMTHEQVRELCAQYDKIDILWFDGEWPHNVEEWQAKRLVKMIRSSQPGILINDRVFHRLPEGGDFNTPEQHIPAAGEEKTRRPWEACLTSTQQYWGWHSGDRIWKSSGEIITAICRAANGGGNLLLNIGPKPDGSFPLPFARRIREVGCWLHANAEAFYATRPGVCEVGSIGFMTVKKNTVYLLVTLWPGKELHLCGLQNEIISARILGSKTRLKVTRKGEHIYLRGLPGSRPHAHCTVIKLKVKGAPQPYPWAADRLWLGDASRMATWAAT